MKPNEGYFTKLGTAGVPLEHKTGHVHSPVTLRYRWLHLVGYNSGDVTLSGTFDLASFKFHIAAP